MNTYRTQGEASDLWHAIEKKMRAENLNMETASRAIAGDGRFGKATLYALKMGTTPDHETLAKLAEFLDVPPSTAYRMAGVIEEGATDEHLQLIAHKFNSIQDEEKRKKIVDTVVMLIESMARH